MRGKTDIVYRAALELTSVSACAASSRGRDEHTATVQNVSLLQNNEMAPPFLTTTKREGESTVEGTFRSRDKNAVC